MTRSERARQYFLEGYTCSQAVAMAFVDLIGLSEEELKKVSLPLGGGLGRLRLTCGAVTGAALVIGMIFGKDEISEENKINVYEKVREISKRFVEKEKTLNCKELLELANLEAETGGNPEKRTEAYYQKRPCAKIVYSAAEILENYLKEEKVI